MSIVNAFIYGAESRGLPAERAERLLRDCTNFASESIAKSVGAEIASHILGTSSPSDAWIAVCKSHRHRHGQLRQSWGKVCPGGPKCGCEIRYANSPEAPSESTRLDWAMGDLLSIEKRYVSKDLVVKGGRWVTTTPPEGTPATKPGKRKGVVLVWAKLKKKGSDEDAKPVHEKTLDEHTADKRKDWEKTNAKRKMTPEEKRKALIGVDVNAAAEHRKAVASAKRKGIAVRDDVAASVKSAPPKPKSEKIVEPTAHVRSESPDSSQPSPIAPEKSKKTFTKNVRIEASGNTLAVKDTLKSRGWKWDRDKKVWFQTLVPAHAERVANGDADFLKGLGGNLKGVVLHLDGDEVWRSKSVQPTGAANSATGIVSTQSASVDELLTKHGRTLRGDGKPATYVTQSQNGGGLSVGDIVPHNNKDGSTTYRMVTKADKPYYVSSDLIEDMDAWSTYKNGRGWYQSYVSVPVEANEKEAKAGAAKAAEQARSAKKDGLIQSLRVAENYSQNGSVSGMTELWGDRRAGGSEVLYTDGSKLTYVVSSYDDGPRYWTTSDKSVVDEAISLSGKSTPSLSVNAGAVSPAEQQTADDRVWVPEQSPHTGRWRLKNLRTLDVSESYSSKADAEADAARWHAQIAKDRERFAARKKASEANRAKIAASLPSEFLTSRGDGWEGNWQ